MGPSAGDVSITLDASGVPYIVYTPTAATANLNVRKYNAATDRWDLVGQAAFLDPSYPQWSIRKAQIFVGPAPRSALYVVATYLKQQQFDPLFTVVVYSIASDTGGRWVNAGGDNHWPFPLIAEDPTMAQAPDGSIHIAVQHTVNYNATIGVPVALGDEFMGVYRLVENPSNPKLPTWSAMADNPIPSSSYKYSYSGQLALAFAPDGTAVVAHVSDLDKCIVAIQCPAGGSSWTRLPGGCVSAGEANSPAIVIDDGGAPYITYRTGATGRVTVKVLRTKDGVSSWDVLGEAEMSPVPLNGKEELYVMPLQLALDSSGSLFLFQKTIVEPGYVHKGADVAVYRDGRWQSVSPPNLKCCAGSNVGAFPAAQRSHPLHFVSPEWSWDQIDFQATVWRSNGA